VSIRDSHDEYDKEYHDGNEDDENRDDENDKE
jgi:hypothetical protein